MEIWVDRKFEMPWKAIVTCSVKVEDPTHSHLHLVFPPRFEKIKEK